MSVEVRACSSCLEMSLHLCNVCLPEANVAKFCKSCQPNEFYHIFRSVQTNFVLVMAAKSKSKCHINLFPLEGHADHVGTFIVVLATLKSRHAGGKVQINV